MKSSGSRPNIRRIGLLAGGGRFPFLFARAARKQGMEVICVGIDGNADPALARFVHRYFRAGVARLGTIIGKFKKERIDCVVMAGKIQKVALFDKWRILRHLPDWRFVRVFLSSTRRDNRDDSLLFALVQEFERDGIHVTSALNVCPELLAGAGCLTRREPLPHEIADIAFGWTLAKEMGRLDIGQSVMIREKVAISVEAIEGTDRAIERAGLLCPAGGFTVIKVAKPQQDMRFDVPAVGRETIETMHRAGATCLAVEASRTIIIDTESTLELANKYGIAVVSLTADDERLSDQTDRKIEYAERRDQRRRA